MATSEADFECIVFGTSLCLELTRFLLTSKALHAVTARKNLARRFPRTPFYDILFFELKTLGDIIGPYESTGDSSSIRLSYGTVTLHYENLSSKEREKRDTLVTDILFHYESSLARSIGNVRDKSPRPLKTSTVKVKGGEHARLATLLDGHFKPDFNNMRAWSRLDQMDEKSFRLMVQSVKNYRLMLQRVQKAVERSSKTLNRGIYAGEVDTYARVQDTRHLGGGFPRNAHAIREQAARAHQFLSDHWRCDCALPHTAVRILLRAQHCGCKANQSFCGCGYTDFQLLLDRNTHNPASDSLHEQEESLSERWLSSNVRVFHEFRITETMRDVPASDNTNQSWKTVDSLCQLVRQTVGGTGLLALGIVDDKLYYKDATIKQLETPRLLSKYLADLIQDQQRPFNRIARRKDRFVLATVLAQALLTLSEGPWFFESNQLQKVQFYTDTSAKVDISRPYLFSMVPRLGYETSKDMPRGWEHPYPTIFAFGCLLMSLELGWSVEMSNLRTADDALQDIMERDLGPSFEPYLHAVQSCLNNRTFEPGRTLQDKTLMEEFYSKVIVPLDAVYRTTFPREVIDVRARLQSMKDKHPSLAIQDNHVGSSRGQRKHDGDKPSRHATLFDDNADFGHKEQAEADEWLLDLKEQIHPMIADVCDGGKKSTVSQSKVAYSSRTVKTEKVGIAILDTGLHLPKLAKMMYPNRVKQCRSWTEAECPEEGLDFQDVDMDGHGTHATGILLEVAPMADIYVAKVFKTRDDMESVSLNTIAQRVARAMRWAINSGKVNIISLSFGFRERIDQIETEIEKARERRILVVAAASNWGGTRPMAWPAMDDLVIGIYASTGAGNKYHMNTTEDSKSGNFSILGVAVKSWVSVNLNQGKEQRRSGTSCATPVAAGIAAIVMALSRHPDRTKLLDDDVRKKVRSALGTSRGMSNIFQRMILGTRDGYKLIVPWEFIQDRDAAPSTIVDNIIQAAVR